MQQTVSMRHLARPALVLAVLACAACDRRTPVTDAGARELSVRVPGALMIARAIDSVSVSLDPASLAQTTVQVDAGTIVGVETECFVFPVGQPRPAVGRHGFVSGAGFDVGTTTWNSQRDGLPVEGTKYVAEMRIVLFETDVPPDRAWEPHAGKFKALWTRTLRQVEE